MFYTYILKSETAPKTYVGHTEDIEKRIKEHNHGYSSFSKQYRPWKIIHLEKFNSKSESIQREKYFKTRTGRRWIKKNVFKL